MNYSVFIPCESAYQLKVVFDSTRLEKKGSLFFCGTVQCPVQGGSNLRVSGGNPKV